MDAASQHRPRPLPLFLDLLRRETAGDPSRMALALAGLRRYQQAPRAAPPPPAPVIARAGRAVLRDHGADVEPGAPVVVFVPSLINPPSVLDMPGDRSLVGWLAAQGVRPLLVDWGTPAPDDAATGLAGHVETMLLPLLRTLDRPPALVGYCLGGTLAIAAAARIRVRSLALIATPWRFSGFPDGNRSDLAALWRSASPAAAAMGLFPMEMFQDVFWRIDAARLVARFAAFATTPDIAGFVALEDWANDGPPLALTAARDLFEGCYAQDLPGRGAWRVAGGAVDPATIACPLLDIVSTRDRIVPATTALGGANRLSLDLGHVGMIVGARAPALLWRPLRDWVSQGATG